ncbi:ABC transporter permease [Variovorax sp. PAMC 28711]|uniref:ABC transporter permease n=1 Tax=Variovorax sp. PAMC 28711 TaxID=1795631 RepID=UPI00078C0398|nr:ABC transporter permease [Variovorax sp. PAMC 28711]AMM23683.1 sugar ABC transporter permease [Variovorax sp. PAMC 28711]
MKQSDAYYLLREHRATLVAAGLFVVIFAIYIGKHQMGWTSAVLTTAANKGVLLAVVAMAQTLVVLTGGIDLSVGMVFVLANCLSSHWVVGTPAQAALGAVGVLMMGALCGFINGAIIVYGRLQPIIATLATGSIYYGLALGLRPVPGGEVQPDVADALTGTLPGGVPSMLVVLLVVVLVVWVPYRRSALGRSALAVGSSEAATYMSGVSVGRTRIVTYSLAGLLAATGGVLLTFVTYSGEASSAIGSVYTLNSIAAVVIGGAVLAGGSGSAVGSIFGAFALRTIGDLLFVFDLEPLWQPLFQGLVLLAAVSFGAFGLFKLRNRLEIYK